MYVYLHALISRNFYNGIKFVFYIAKYFPELEVCIFVYTVCSFYSGAQN
jgi:hypothetical protein